MPPKNKPDIKDNAVTGSRLGAPIFSFKKILRKTPKTITRRAKMYFLYGINLKN